MTPARQILIADDSQSSRDLLRFIIERIGYQVIEAENGAAALQHAMAHRPDLFILDLNMPELDGYAVATRLKKIIHFAHTPIIALTAAASLTDPLRIADAGFSMFLTKPIAPAKLRACIACALGLHSGFPPTHANVAGSKSKPA